MTTARIPPGDRAEVGVFTWALSRGAGRVMGTRPPNLFLTLGRHRRLFRAWLWFAGRLMPRGTLPRHEAELVILRVAHLRDCDYELEHHRRLGARAGLGPADLERVATGSTAGGWSPRERAILRAVEAMNRDGEVDDETWAELRTHLDERECIELCLLAGHYEMLATVVATLRIEPDAPRR